MKACWHKTPEMRPSFTDLRNTMRGMCEEEKVCLSFQFLSFSYEAIHLFFLSPVVITGVRDPMSSIYSLKKGNYPCCFIKNADYSLHNHFAFALICQAWTLHDIVHQFLGISLSVNRG